MPPYAGDQGSAAAVDVANDQFVDFQQLDKKEGDAPPALLAPSPSEDSQDDNQANPESKEEIQEETTDTSVTNCMNFFNPCAGGASSSSSSSSAPVPAETAPAAAETAPPAAAAETGWGFPNPSPSHVFKTRKCAECGGDISKFKGYKKEVVSHGTADDALFDEDESVGGEQGTKKCHKIYYMKGCYKIKQYRDEHKKTFSAVLQQLLDHFAEIELQKQLKAAEEEAMRLKAEEEEVERQRLEEEKAKKEAGGKKKSSLKLLKMKSVKKGFSSLKLRSWKKKNKKSAVEAVVTSPDGKWTRYYDPKHQRHYYSDGETTTWTEPASFKADAETPDADSTQ